jgi:hypothetical protein
MKERLKNIIQNKALIFLRQNDYLLEAKDDPHFIFDFRKVFLEPKDLSIFVDFFLELYQDKIPFQIACVELSSVPLL